MLPALPQRLPLPPGDLLGEERRGEESLAALQASLAEGGAELDVAERAKRYFLRSIAYFFAGDRRRALDDVDRVLRQLPFDQAIGFFTDAVGFLAVWVGGGDLEHDRLAAGYLAAFRERLKDRRGLAPVLTRVQWSGAQLCGRLGDLREARRLHEVALRRLLADGRPVEVAAVALDVCQLLCRRRDWGINARSARRLIDRCLEQRPDLAADHGDGLEKMKSALEYRPEDAFRELVAYRRSFIAPVPGVMAERLEAWRDGAAPGTG